MVQSQRGRWRVAAIVRIISFCCSRLVEKEMISLQHLHVEVTGGLFTPEIEIGRRSLFIARSTQHRDRASQRLTRNVGVRMTNRKVGSEQRDH